MFHSVTSQDIKEGKVTDIYFTRTFEILKAKGINKRVKGEIIAKKLPRDWQWAVLAGVEECASLLEGINVNVKCLAEGTFFREYDPVFEIEGNYTDFGVYETSVLGFLCQASGIATAAARCRRAAGDRLLISFGARRMHPAISPMIERNAFIGGCDGVSCIKGAGLIGEEPMGTMPHALILIMGDTVEATRAFDEVISKRVNRVSLIDTFNDEKFEALRVAKALDKNLFAVRLDTPSSRRGNFLEIIKEVRWELDLRGYNSVKLFVSGGMDEKSILELNSLVDAYGVGTSISNAPVVDFSLDIIEIEGVPRAKRGKMSGSKKLLRCPKCFSCRVVPGEELKVKSEELRVKSEEEGRCDCGESFQLLTEPLIENGRIVRDIPKPQEIRRVVLDQLRHFSGQPIKER
ncbi:MAG: nicotinate phosphoribosyltransferase [Deltaproteobacteria bacterium CG12_big_fil_rev_8_21_14_0_65_43_10]|nr:MAG: nicotinate phosphoribosyltransferase [Deltaproteobacteria bacterium CG2_30_43_15]PIQ44777.1 MAG: nicotinate phosphoribosyltransferase [Deltaproteobacteria bacterium CG12_big_fil_rev_8_21_14_0_65_43_10]PIU86682.1 MAG: nicotinate phosphoribosyltransferase [Deltaproteobacteria bacterium CG06_land_8_20_14_3_00_44_19]PIX26548.1 MAG: nicotinate phosphoribosyltransferase [Deltaproteobacteria bacterium CG_4_8_14_3_um_filter_43_13]PIZ19598.1 MAG: nicotinate phosphoribosyltransferase [Deltaproteo